MIVRETRWLLGLVLLSASGVAQAERGARADAALSEVGGAFSGVEAGAAPAAPVSADAWWLSLGSAELDAIMAAGLAANPDVLTAQRQLAQAEALAAQSFSALLPSVTANSTLNGQPIEAQTFAFDFPGAASDGNRWAGATTLGASWSVDLWGRNLMLWLASRQDALASAASAEGRALTVSTTVAGAWLDVVYHRSRVQVIEQQAALSASLLEVTELRYTRGDATALDVLQQRQQVASTRALLPTSRALLRVAEQQLAVLLGRSPDAPPEVLTASLPEVPATPGVGTPDALMARSPSVQSAQAALDAAERRVQAAWRATLPTVTLSANTGPQYVYDSDGLLPASSDDVKSGTFWSAGASASWPLFKGGSAYNGLRAAQASADAAQHALESAALSALRQVEGALVLEQERALSRAAVEEQRAAARLAFEAAQDQYQQGVTAFIPVLTAQQTLLQAELAALQAHRDQLDARVQLVSALGAAHGQEN